MKDHTNDMFILFRALAALKENRQLIEDSSLDDDMITHGLTFNVININVPFDLAYGLCTFVHRALHAHTAEYGFNLADVFKELGLDTRYPVKGTTHEDECLCTTFNTAEPCAFWHSASSLYAVNRWALVDKCLSYLESKLGYDYDELMRL